MPVEGSSPGLKAIKLHGITEIPVDSTIAINSAMLPNYHNDPFDRLIIATATINQLSIVTADQKFNDYEINIVW